MTGHTVARPFVIYSVVLQSTQQYREENETFIDFLCNIHQQYVHNLKRMF